ncbi:RNA polymerase II transcription factor SIII subunit A-domain-containing protein [Pseudomassariella vexata]|uniref:RNA polymerase II transcription factor SIII subunit A-domain-containing protein n=1 Tax=Pseudomassariella vexata TaxID=1141098 RepID=A0A1Y2E3W4_9PEZI|nr:RNA polymerase II transcription factor SIII subunit A-domain-containing protein [Pseudomassariella vexata]ORY66241.1 RNA polymerase II transcription factor SIII subunit A-domain-containing protein [Pseudomassariella vexata]
MPRKSLVELCTVVCIKNIKEITDIGSTPYHLIRHVLLRIDTAQHLLELEQTSPHLALDDAECWLRLIERDFGRLHNEYQYAPKNPASWNRVYFKYEKFDRSQKEEAQEKLRNAFAGLKKKKEDSTAEVITFDRKRLPPPPRDRSVGGMKKVAIGRRGGSNDTGELRFTSGTRTKVTNAKSIMRKVKREAKEIHNRNRLATPGGALVVDRRQLKQAPKGLVEAHRVTNQPAFKIHAPAMRPSAEQMVRDQEMQEREARLLRLKAGKSATFISDSDLEDEDDYNDDAGQDYGGGGLNEDDLEDLFDDESSAQKKPYQSRPSSTSKSGLLSNKRPSLLSNSSRSASSVQRAVGRPSEQPKPASSPPLGSASSPPMPQKRKAVSMFHQPKKVQRR